MLLEAKSMCIIKSGLEGIKQTLYYSQDSKALEMVVVNNRGSIIPLVLSLISRV